MAGAVRVQLRCVTGLRGRGSVQLCHGAAHRKLLQRPAKVLFAGKHACHAIEGLADPDLLIRGDRLFGDGLLLHKRTSDLPYKSRCHDMTAGLVRIRSGRAAAPGGLPSCCMMLHRHGCLRMLCHLVLFRRICHRPRREAYIASGTGISRLWQGCPIPAAPWLVRLTSAAGIPLKSVGGRSWGCVSPALSSRPMLPCIGSKAA